jgi:hypothetical protein
MPKTIRVSEEAYDRLHTTADTMGAPVRDVVDDYLLSMGDIVGYCPEHGIPFTEEDINSPLIGSEFVVCPKRYQTQQASERAHQEVTGGSEKIPVEKLSKDQSAEQDAEDGEDSPMEDDDEPA